jgi:hypothetical protein
MHSKEQAVKLNAAVACGLLHCLLYFFSEVNMRDQSVTLPELALVASTRVLLGAGLGLLLAARLNDDQRRTVG